VTEILAELFVKAAGFLIELLMKPDSGHHKDDTGTGWRRFIGYLKLQVVMRKRASNYRALLRKMTCKDKAYYESLPPCSGNHKVSLSVRETSRIFSRIVVETQ